MKNGPDDGRNQSPTEVPAHSNDAPLEWTSRVAHEIIPFSRSRQPYWDQAFLYYYNDYIECYFFIINRYVMFLFQKKKKKNDRPSGAVAIVADSRFGIAANTTTAVGQRIVMPAGSF